MPGTRPDRGGTVRRDWALLAILSSNFGAAFLSRNSVGLTGPFIQHGLALNNAQLGALSAALGFSWAAVGYFGTSLLGDRVGVRKALIALGLLDALSLFWLAASGSFHSVMLSRILAGAAAGPVLPLSQALISRRSEMGRRGARMGVVQALGGGFIGAIVGPLLLVPAAASWGWRAPFWICAAVCLAAAFLLWVNPGAFGPESTARREEAPATADVVTMSSRRNLLLCCLLSVLVIGWLVITTTFVPVFLVGSLGWSSSRMGVAMSGFGITSMLSAILLPMLSDRIGRRSAVTIGAGLGAIAALSICSSWSTTPLVAVVGVGIGGGTIPLFMSAIPSESAPVTGVASWIALVQGVGEIFGGVVAPLLTGVAADIYGPRSALEVAAGCVCLAAAVSLFLIETNPRSSAG